MFLNIIANLYVCVEMKCNVMNEYLNIKWSQWKASIPLISDVEIQRFYSKLVCYAEDVQLHTFVDAVEYAYADLSYLVVQLGERVTVSLVAQKNMDLWLSGPAFLRDDPSQWAACEDLEEMNTLKLKRHVLLIDKKPKDYNIFNF